MNKILKEIQNIIIENINKYLPGIQEQLEENGTIYYMNGKNGTEWDWYVNEHLSNFMVFYNDKDNLGAAKLSLYQDGYVDLYIYDENGKHLLKQIETKIEESKEKIFELAIILKKEADNKEIWDTNIEKINTDIDISEKDKKEFEKTKEYMQPTINRNRLLSKKSYVSKKIIEENYKVGYMYREESDNEKDSGWIFMAGNEDDEYNDDYKNIAIIDIYQVYQLDPDILEYIDNPVGSKFIRISSNKFEEDKNNKEIYIEKRT